MKLPDWTKPALGGAVTGAIAVAVIGFNWGGWMTTGGAEDMAKKQTALAIVETLTPYCFQSARADSTTYAQFVALKSEPARAQRAFIEEAGWATPPGGDRAVAKLSEACLAALNEAL